MKLSNLYSGIILVTLLLLTDINHAKTTESTDVDTMHIDLEREITVIGTRLSRSSVDFPFEKSRFADVLQTNGFGLVKKGVFLAQDVYVDGFKRGDIELVIDGERFYCACPNRMDSPISRANSLEMESITLNKSSANAQCGLGGNISFNREKPKLQTLVRAGLSQALVSAEESDFGFTFNANNHRFAGRYSRGHGFEDADGHSFEDLYGYKENSSYYLIEGSVTGIQHGITYRAEMTYSEDIMFPYLMMDERDNTFVSGSASYRGHKFYINYTEHLMDNGLRKSSMAMLTDATNLTLGLTGDFYDFYFRHWNADNNIETPMATIYNHLIPDVSKFYGSLNHRIRYDYFDLWGKIGISYHYTPDNDILDFYKLLYSDASNSKTDLLIDLGGSFHYTLSGKASGKIVVDLTSQAPSTEFIFISVMRPMGKAWWSGNPTLNTPVRISARNEFSFDKFSVEAFGTFVKNYIDLTGITTTERNYRTYENIDAVFVGGNLKGEWKYFDVTASYTWAENTKTNSPLVEIPPFSLKSNLKFPDYSGFSAFLRHIYNDSQTRVDTDLNELPTSSWHQLDLGLGYKTGIINLSLNILNVTDELYYQHLSYLRNPYASGMQVNEPGRTILLTIMINSIGN